jgi:hypothetical protein
MNSHAAVADVPALARLQQRALILGVVALAAGVAGAFLNPDQFFRSWMIGFLFCLGLSLGSLGLLMMQHLTGGEWGLAGRRIFEAASRGLPYVTLIFIPLLFGMRRIFLWARPEAVAADHILQMKAPYLNVSFFIVRAVVYFVIWLGCMYYLNRWSDGQDRGEVAVTAADTRRFRVVSGPGLLLYALTITFASVDWVMSLDPHWFSTIFGLLLFTGQGLAAFAFVIAILALVSNVEPVASVISPRQFHDLGKLLLAFVMLWAYLSFSQFLIIWAGNLPDEIPWYLDRIRGPWGYVALLIAFGHFALPFVVLLSRDLKKNRMLLAKVAIAILIMRFVDIVWLVAPTFQHQGFPIHWMNIVIPAGLVSVWLFLFARQLQSHPLLPLNDPFFKETFAHESH